MSAHSSGPWEMIPGNAHHGPYVVSLFGTTICDLYVMTEPGALSVRNGGPSKPVPFGDADANAALIARAPDLLADNTALTARVAKLEAALRWSYANRRAGDAQELMARAYNAEPQTPRTKADEARHTAEMWAWEEIAQAHQGGEETWRAEVRAAIAARAALTPEPK